ISALDTFSPNVAQDDGTLVVTDASVQVTLDSVPYTPFQVDTFDNGGFQTVTVVSSSATGSAAGVGAASATSISTQPPRRRVQQAFGWYRSQAARGATAYKRTRSRST